MVSRGVVPVNQPRVSVQHQLLVLLGALQLPLGPRSAQIPLAFSNGGQDDVHLLDVRSVLGQASGL